MANPAVGGDRLAPRPGVQVAHHNAGGGARPILPTAAIQASALSRDVLLTGGRSPEEIIRIDTGNGLLIDFQSSPGAAQQPSYEAASLGSSLGHMIVPTGFPGIEKFPPILASALSPTPIG